MCFQRKNGLLQGYLSVMIRYGIINTSAFNKQLFSLLQEMMSEKMVDFSQNVSMEVENQEQQVQPHENPLPPIGSSENLLTPKKKVASELNQSHKEINIQNSSEAKKTQLIQQINDPVDEQPQNHENKKKTKPKTRKQKLKELNDAFLRFDDSNDSKQRVKENIQKLALNFEISEEYVWNQYRKFKKSIVPVKDQQTLSEFLQILPAFGELVELFDKYRKKTNYFIPEQAIEYVYTHKQGDYGEKSVQFIFEKYLKENAEAIKKEIQLSEDQFIYKIYEGYKKNENAILFFSDFYYFTHTEEVFSVGLLCGEQGLEYEFTKQDGIPKKHDLKVLLEKYWFKYKRAEKFVVVIGVNEIFKSNPRRTNYNNQHELFTTLQRYGASLFPLPRDQSHMNLAAKIIERVKFPHKKKEQDFVDLMSSRLDDEQKFYSRNLFLSYTTKREVKIEISDDDSEQSDESESEE